MLTQLYNDDYVARKRNVLTGTPDEAPIHFILTMVAMLPQPNGSIQPVAQTIPLVEVDGTIVAWNEATIHPKTKRVQA